MYEDRKFIHTRYGGCNVIALLNHDFELIEDNNIDIDSIEEIVVRLYKGFTDICEYLEEKGNEIIRSLKQLNREIKELKEKTNEYRR